MGSAAVAALAKSMGLAAAAALAAPARRDFVGRCPTLLFVVRCWTTRAIVARCLLGMSLSVSSANGIAGLATHAHFTTAELAATER